jgi:hypothetical protein
LCSSSKLKEESDEGYIVKKNVGERRKTQEDEIRYKKKKSTCKNYFIISRCDIEN